MTACERKQIEHMMRIAVAMQGLIDTVLAQGDALLNPPDDSTNAPRAPKAAESAGLDDDPTDPPRFMRPRATVPNLEG